MAVLQRVYCLVVGSDLPSWGLDYEDDVASVGRCTRSIPKVLLHVGILHKE